LHARGHSPDHFDLDERFSGSFRPAGGHGSPAKLPTFHHRSDHIGHNRHSSSNPRRQRRGGALHELSLFHVRALDLARPPGCALADNNPFLQYRCRRSLCRSIDQWPFRTRIEVLLMPFKQLWHANPDLAIIPSHLLITITYFQNIKTQSSGPKVKSNYGRAAIMHVKII